MADDHLTRPEPIGPVALPPRWDHPPLRAPGGHHERCDGRVLGELRLPTAVQRTALKYVRRTAIGQKTSVEASTSSTCEKKTSVNTSAS